MSALSAVTTEVTTTKPRRAGVMWPGKRETYDGKPYIPPPAGEDEEWIPGPKETPDDVSLGAIPG